MIVAVLPYILFSSVVVNVISWVADSANTYRLPVETSIGAEVEYVEPHTGVLLLLNDPK